MPKSLTPPLAGVAVTVFLLILLHLVGLGGIGALMIALGLGLVTFGLLQNAATSAALPRASNAERDAALAGDPPASLARVLIYRSTQFAAESMLGGKVAVQLTMDGSKIDALPAEAFVHLLVPPGEHTFTAGVGLKAAKATLRALPGETLLVHLVMPSGSLGKRFELNLSEQPAPVFPALRTLALMSATIRQAPLRNPAPPPPL